jgi:hypothetical protein
MVNLIMPSTEAESIDPHEQNSEMPKVSSEAVGNKAVEIACASPEPPKPLETGEPAEAVLVAPPKDTAKPQETTASAKVKEQSVVTRTASEKEAPAEKPKPEAVNVKVAAAEKPNKEVVNTQEKKEQPTTSEARAKFHEKWEEVMYENREEEQKKFEAIHARVQALLPDDNSREALGYSADIVQWALWGSYKDPLPAGLKRKVNKDEQTSTIALNEDLLTPFTYDEGVYLLNINGLHDLRKEMGAERHEKEAEVVPELAEVINELPVAQAIATIASSVNPEAEDQPLNEVGKMIENSKLSRSIVAETDGVSNNPVQRTDIGHSKYKQGQFAIEMHTDSQPNKTPQNAARWARVKDFIHGAAQEGAARGFTPDTIYLSPYNDTASLAGKYLRQELATTNQYDEEGLIYHTGYTLVGALLEADPKDDFDKRFAAARKSAARALLRHGSSSTRIPFTKQGKDESYLEKQAWLYNPQTTRHQESSPTYDIRAAKSALLDASGAGVKWELAPKEQGSIGEILHDATESRGRIMRYVMGEAPPINPLDMPSDTLVIAVEKREGKIVDVPGMRLLGKREGDRLSDYYCFAPTKEADPYAPCFVKLPPTELRELTEKYRSIELIELADALESIKNPTVWDLQQQLGLATDYPDMKERSSHEITTLDDCTAFVKKGRLEAPCTGAFLVLKLSLEALYEEKCSISAIKGHLLKKNTISEVGHIQLGFAYGDSLYYLDSGARQPGELDSLIAFNHKPPRISAELRELKQTPSKEVKLQTPFDAVKAYQMFQASLARAYELPKIDPELVHKTIARLPKVDPVFRTYSLSHRAAKYGFTDEIKDEMRRLRKFIGNIQTAQARKDTNALAGTLQAYLKPETASLLQALDTHLGQYLD